MDTEGNTKSRSLILGPNGKLIVTEQVLGNDGITESKSSKELEKVGTELVQRLFDVAQSFLATQLEQYKNTIQDRQTRLAVIHESLMTSIKRIGESIEQDDNGIQTVDEMIISELKISLQQLIENNTRVFEKESSILIRIQEAIVLDDINTFVKTLSELTIETDPNRLKQMLVDAEYLFTPKTTTLGEKNDIEELVRKLQKLNESSSEELRISSDKLDQNGQIRAEITFSESRVKVTLIINSGSQIIDDYAAPKNGDIESPLFKLKNTMETLLNEVLQKKDN